MLVSSCQFVGQVVHCSLDYLGMDVHVTGIVNLCNDPLDFTFVVKVSDPPVRWEHSFAVSNIDETVPIQGLNSSESSLTLRIAFSTNDSSLSLHNSSSSQTIFVYGYLEGGRGARKNPPYPPFLNSSVSLVRDPECHKNLLKSPQSAAQVIAVISLSLFMVALVTGLLIYIYCQRRRKASDMASLAASFSTTAPSINGAVPYQEEPKVTLSVGDVKLKMKEDGSKSRPMDASLVIENPNAATRRSDSRPDASRGAIPKRPRNRGAATENSVNSQPVA
ncbi:unnamed protein product [Darwinula stevensoni]|uniref:Uncharacterized protein n=1 Tax=Darwinula stevensoni TaxID=69355 RepID=A0A7R9FS96_9CRUS|nr:unnamed protein product [Darwinula stevensoni]CAG0902179.1 unnamed protein product [Darwinula stevensoni]